MKIILEKLIEDREAGTPGPWRIRENVRHSQEECDLTICGDIWQLADINGPQYAHQGANARRIARLPDLEAAFLEAVELLRKCEKGDADYAFDVGVTDFLERNS